MLSLSPSYSTPSRQQLIEHLDGFALVRIHPGEKRPIGNGWQSRSTRNLADVCTWSRNSNVGILGGELLPNGQRLIIVDVDCKNDKAGLESWVRLQGDFQLPRTCSVITPSGGQHYYFSVPADTPLSNIARLLDKVGYPGIDLIGSGLYVLAPPSRINRGDYVWSV